MAQSPIQMRSLFVGNIPKDLESPEEFLANYFGKFGLILSVKLCRDINTQKSLGHAYVNFQNIADAERAQQQLNYSELPNYPGRELRVAFSERDPNVRARGKALFIKNIDTNMTNKALQELFAEFGAVIDCSQATDKQGKKLGFGSVQFAEADVADKALAALNGKLINGKELHVAVKEREEDKTYTKIFVRNIRPDATDDEVRVALGTHAKPVGAVASLIVNMHPSNNTRSAIIDLGDHEAAVQAVEALNDKIHSTLSPDGLALSVVAYRKPAERRVFAPSMLQNDGRNLYVRNLPDRLKEEELRSLFSPFGEIESVSLAMEGDVFRGFAFVCFKTREAATDAIAKLHRSMFFNRPLYVNHAQHHDQRQNLLAEQHRQILEGPSVIGAPFGVPPPHVAGMMGGMPPHPRGGFGVPPFGVPPQMAGMMNPAALYRGAGPMMGPMGVMPPHAFGGRGAFGAPRGGFNGMGPFGGRGGAGGRGGFPAGARPYGRGGPRVPHNGAPVVAPAAAQREVMTLAHLHGKSTEEQKNILGEKLYHGVMRVDPERAAKITGMLLELPVEEVLAAINDETYFNSKVVEAQNILAQHA